MLSTSYRLLSRTCLTSSSVLQVTPRRCLAGVSRAYRTNTSPILRAAGRRSLTTKVPPESSSTTTSDESKTTAESSLNVSTDKTAEDSVYHGPLTNTFRRLKLFSLSSLALTVSLAPFIFVIETTSNLPLSGRFALAGVAIATSGVSTGLVAWAGRPYVTKLRWLEGGRGIEMTTLTVRLRERVTKVYDTAFLVPATRPLATFELAEAFQLPAEEVNQGKKDGSLPREETIAETLTPQGTVVGRWIVRWDEEGKGACRPVGKVARHFNVHQELLDRPIR
ncbi:uncharacterized protein C8Q71DRAFT_770942 [Rhodofomes roseus]|uniref:Uncharacterized protein n=1 Tax=Rhodofomes roseus TaxID=34475 RepID=A0ABQ8K9P6_9APHY|nr:uncharacterized protein C8Q71DRAFT_770942 [Rhodofomes roseus]KAH9834075.1 hypothetical protein C8Q71DRAFT_770942 [Rhodofomes roseus]